MRKPFTPNPRTPVPEPKAVGLFVPAHPNQVQGSTRRPSNVIPSLRTQNVDLVVTAHPLRRGWLGRVAGSPTDIISPPWCQAQACVPCAV